MTDLLPVLCGVAVVLSFLAFGFSLLRLRRPAVEAVPASHRGMPAGLLLLLVVVLTGGGVASIWMLNKPVYRAMAVVRISPVVDTIVFNPDKNVIAENYPLFVNTELSVMHSPTVLERVLDQSELRDTEWYKDANKQEIANASSELMERLQEGLEVTPRTGTEMVDVFFSAPKGEDAKTITNLVVQQYKRLKDEMERSNKTQLYETLMTEQGSLQMDIDGLLKTKFNIARRYGTDRMDDLQADLSKRFYATESEVNLHHRELDLMQWEAKTAITGVDATTLPADAKMHSVARSQIDRKTQVLKLLEDDLARQRGKLAEAGEIALEISTYDEKIRQKRELYDAVRKRRERLEMEDKAPGRVRVAAYALSPSQPFNDRRALLTGIIVGAATIVSLSVVALRPRR